MKRGGIRKRIVLRAVGSAFLFSGCVDSDTQRGLDFLIDQVQSGNPSFDPSLLNEEHLPSSDSLFPVRIVESSQLVHGDRLIEGSLFFYQSQNYPRLENGIFPTPGVIFSFSSSLRPKNGFASAGSEVYFSFPYGFQREDIQIFLVYRRVLLGAPKETEKVEQSLPVDWPPQYHLVSPDHIYTTSTLLSASVDIDEAVRTNGPTSEMGLFFTGKDYHLIIEKIVREDLPF